MRVSQPSTRFLAILPVVMFLPTLVSYVVAPGSPKAEYSGILFHVAMLFLVARLKAPDWAKGAAYGWLALDIATGSLIIHGVPYDKAVFVRLGGHVLAGVWFIGASLANRGAIRVLGVVVGAWLAGYTMVSDYLSLNFLRPGGLLMIMWLVVVAVQSGRAERKAVTANRPAALDGASGSHAAIQESHERI